MTVAVDLGGTWTRIRIGDQDTRIPTPSFLRHPERSPGSLLSDQVDVLAELVPKSARVALSCGAALDETTGIAWGSGPLWGPGDGTPVDILAALGAARPDVIWHVVNDVTAGLANFVHRYARPADRRVAYLTVSSGIALRTADLVTRTISVDSRGLQGEVGHLTATTTAPAAIARARCSCGGEGHIASVSSGPAIAHVVDVLGIDPVIGQDLARHVEEGHAGAAEVVSTIVEPVAELLRTMTTLDPTLDLVGIGGGVAAGIGDVYRSILISQLNENRSYADSPHLDIRVCASDDVDTLAGAIAMMEGALHVIKC